MCVWMFPGALNLIRSRPSSGGEKEQLIMAADVFLLESEGSGGGRG